MSLIISFRSEILKSKRTAAFYFTLIGAAVIPFILLINIIADGLPGEGRASKDPINAMFKLSSDMTGLALFPLFIVLICTLLPQIEFKNSTWKQVLTSPQKKEDVFVAKFLNIHLLMILFLVASHLFIWVVVIASHFILPQFNILNHSFDASKVLQENVHTYLSCLGICAVQFWIGLRSRNFIVPIAIGLTLWLFGTVLVLEYHSSASPYFPYCFPAIRFSSLFSPRLNQVEWTSFGYSFLFLVIGFIDFRRRRKLK
ncbi:ABC transporter permease [Terrimonas sp. NA20]|uniref:ABC transporter permease n=1 Tax=Terrimonas ginsenosidimutans TaxID=2908004 RepID=A0ABS9KS91_9BACT|nr:ABC transporter permease [Terrimonas ginsenosidimutans]MCG2615175.1 ABC transporter permease [Terrimonas ginsenosidimutans]